MFLLCLAAFALTAAEMKVLTIGNSFTWSLRKHLPQIAKAQGDKLTLAFANHGGCSIQKHWGFVAEEEADASKCNYRYKGKKVKLRDILAAEKWDIITIQQASRLSWVKGSFYPELDNLVAYVKKHAPNSEIVFQQTWAYRADHNLLKKCGGQQAMYDGIYNNYKEASAKFGLRVIPAGFAVQLAREAQPVKFNPVDKKTIADAKKTPGSTVDQTGSFNVGWRWAKNRKTGKTEFSCDASHLNDRGEYLQSCVWYGFIFKKSPLEIKYNGKGLPAEDVAMLKSCADKALKEYK